MGSLGQTFFGGSNQNQSSNSSSNSNSVSGNYALNFLLQTLGAPAQYLGAGGDMIGSLLGIPGYGNRPAGTPQPAPVPIPTITQPSLPPALQHIDLFHDGINGNGKKAQKAGKPTSYWVDQYGKPATAPSGGGN